MPNLTSPKFCHAMCHQVNSTSSCLRYSLCILNLNASLNSFRNVHIVRTSRTRSASTRHGQDIIRAIPIFSIKVLTESHLDTMILLNLCLFSSFPIYGKTWGTKKSLQKKFTTYFTLHIIVLKIDSHLYQLINWVQI